MPAHLNLFPPFGSRGSPLTGAALWRGVCGDLIKEYHRFIEWRGIVVVCGIWDGIDSGVGA